MSRAHRSAYIKFRCGVVLILIELGPWKRLNYNDRTCLNCTGEVENEKHVLFTCPIYHQLRESMFTNISLEFPNLMTSADDEKLSAIFSCQSFHSIRNCAKIFHEILSLRRNMLYNTPFITCRAITSLVVYRLPQTRCFF